MKNLITKKQKDRVDSICEKYQIKNYSINSDGSIDVDGDVDISKQNLTKFPIVFNNVSGNFTCKDNMIKSLKGGPVTVGGNFVCAFNDLSSLAGSPESVGDDFSCKFNNLKNLIGSPRNINGMFSCGVNKLTSLEGAPDTVGGNFECYDNVLSSLLGGPHTVSGTYSCWSNNGISSMVGIAHTICGGFYGTNENFTSTYSGDIDIEFTGKFHTGHTLPQLLLDNLEHIKMILKYQRHFEIWNDDLTLNNEKFQVLLDEIKDGLE